MAQLETGCRLGDAGRVGVADGGRLQSHVQRLARHQQLGEQLVHASLPGGDDRVPGGLRFRLLDVARIGADERLFRRDQQRPAPAGRRPLAAAQDEAGEVADGGLRRHHHRVQVRGRHLGAQARQPRRRGRPHTPAHSCDAFATLALCSSLVRAK